MFVARRGPQPKYDTDVWLNDHHNTIKKDVDYECSTASMVIHLRRIAKRMGKRVTIRRTEQPEGIEFQSWQIGT